MTAVTPIHGSCDARFAKVREVFEHNFDSGLEIGAAVAVTLDGRSVVDLWGGHVDRARTREWQRDTIVNTYSTTKGMTAICAHRLIEQGKLDVDVPVAQYWPEFAAAGKQELPVRYLLSQPAILLHYLRLAVWPDPLIFDYGWPAVERGTEVVAPAAAILALLGRQFPAGAGIDRPMGALGGAAGALDLGADVRAGAEAGVDEFHPGE